MAGHRDLATVGQHEGGIVPELLDGAEDVVPAPAVEPRRVLAKLIKDLVHLEGRENGLDQHRRPDGAARDAEFILSRHKDLVPQTRLQVVFELGQVEVRTGALVDEPAGVVEEEQPEVEQRARHRLAVQKHVLLGHVPAARTHEQRRQLVVEPVMPAGRGIGVLDIAGDGVAKVDLALDHIVPGGGVRVLEIGHEHVGAGIERVDDHLAVGGPGDLDPPVEGIFRGGRDGPVALADLPGPGQEVAPLPRIEPRLDLEAAGEQFPPFGSETAFELGHEGKGIGRKHGLITRFRRAQDFEPRRGSRRR